MGKEIERKFLVNQSIWAQTEKPAGTEIRQGYIAQSENNTVRVRTKNNQGFLTIKGATKGITRAEYEYEIPYTDAVEMLAECASNSIVKIRYSIFFNDKCWEVDEFLLQNSGLILAEIELRHEDELFDSPDFIAQEVTSDARYYNAYLAAHPYSLWKKK